MAMRWTSAARTKAVRQVRLELQLAGRAHGRYMRDLDIARLFAAVQDAGLCADAICMWPRPKWVEAIVGPYPALLELANPEDVASVEEWGAGGTAA